MRLSLAATFVALTLSGCMSQGVPDWAMHVRSLPVEAGEPAEDVAARLQAEMAQPVLAPNHLAPEQIALVALQEIERDHQVDAALWLSMASYRYHQEALVATSTGTPGERTLPPNVRRSAYLKLVETEVERFVSMGFQHEVAVLEGAPTAAAKPSRPCSSS